jgi:hypothetical protein
VVSLYRDEDLLTPTKHDHELPSTPHATPSKSFSIKPKRAPLTSKLSNDIINLPQTPKSKAPVGKKGSKPVSDHDSDIVCLGTVEKPKQVSKPSHTSTKQKEKSKPRGPKKLVSDGVILPLSKSTPRKAPTQITSTISEVTEEVSNLSIETEPTASPSASTSTLSPIQELDRLVAASTSTQVQDFSTFVSSQAVLSLLDPTSDSSSSSSSALRKIGEASYSEVFSMGIVGGNKIVIKVIPLVNHETGDVASEDIPDTSYPRDVLRELEITQRMGEGEGPTSHFVKYLG